MNGRGVLAAGLSRLAALVALTGDAIAPRHRLLVAAGAVAIGIGMVTPQRLHAQGVLIAPQAVVIDSRTRTGELTLVNESDTPAEIAVSALYGYPVTDSIGMMSLKVFDTVPDTAPSAAPWIQVFPRRLRLSAHARQTLRVLVSPPDTIAQREYWARLVVAVRNGTIPVATSDSSRISASLALEVRSVLGVFYRNGAVSTGVTMSEPKAQVQHDSLVTRVDLVRTGNAAFVGSLIGTVRNSIGTAVGHTTLPLGVYYTLSPRLAMATGRLPAGKYTVTVEAVTSRPDVAPKLLVNAPSVKMIKEIVVP